MTLTVDELRLLKFSAPRIAAAEEMQLEELLADLYNRTNKPIESGKSLGATDEKRADTSLNISYAEEDSAYDTAINGGAAMSINESTAADNISLRFGHPQPPISRGTAGCTLRPIQRGGCSSADLILKVGFGERQKEEVGRNVLAHHGLGLLKSEKQGYLTVISYSNDSRFWVLSAYAPDDTARIGLQSQSKQIWEPVADDAINLIGEVCLDPKNVVCSHGALLDAFELDMIVPFWYTHFEKVINELPTGYRLKKIDQLLRLESIAKRALSMDFPVTPYIHDFTAEHMIKFGPEQRGSSDGHTALPKKWYISDTGPYPMVLRIFKFFRECGGDPNELAKWKQGEQFPWDTEQAIAAVKITPEDIRRGMYYHALVSAGRLVMNAHLNPEIGEEVVGHLVHTVSSAAYNGKLGSHQLPVPKAECDATALTAQKIILINIGAGNALMLPGLFREDTFLTDRVTDCMDAMDASTPKLYLSFKRP